MNGLIVAIAVTGTALAALICVLVWPVLKRLDGVITTPKRPVLPYTGPKPPRRETTAPPERIALPCEEQTVARREVAGHPPWSGSHPRVAGGITFDVPVPAAPDLPGPLTDGAADESPSGRQGTLVRAGEIHQDHGFESGMPNDRSMAEYRRAVAATPAVPRFIPSARPAQSWNCLMTPPKRRVRPHDHTCEFPAIRRVPDWAQRMLDCPLADLARVVTADSTHCHALSGALA